MPVSRAFSFFIDYVAEAMVVLNADGSAKPVREWTATDKRMAVVYFTPTHMTMGGERRMLLGRRIY